MATTIFAADVLQHVPHDALGFVVIKNLDATDTKVDRLLKTLSSPYPSPLVFLKAVTGIDEGLNTQGAFLLAVLPGDGDDDSAPQFAVWLPVSDYDSMLKSLGATAGDAISAIRVADEDLLIARLGDWAFVMDPNQRGRMEQMLADKPNPPATIAVWKAWIDVNDVAVVVLPGGVSAALRWADKAPAGVHKNPEAAEESTDDLFGAAEEVADPFAVGAAAAQATGGNYDPIQAAIHKWIGRSPELHDWFKHAAAISFAARLDDQGNAMASLRVKSSDEHPFATGDDAAVPSPPSMYQQLDFVVHGAGHLPASLVSVASATYARQILNELKDAEHVDLNDKTAARFVQAFQAAASEIASWAVASPLGKKTDGAYTNNFLALRVASAKTFAEHAGDVMQLWNQMHRDAKDGTRMVFDIEETKIGERAATQYSLDVATIDGMPAIPEIRQAMERFFGPGGKLRVWLVQVDDQTVLLAAATPEQVTKGLQLLNRKLPTAWNQPELSTANRLLPEQSDVRLFMSPHGRSKWHRRLSEAMTGPHFGPPAKEFPESPPIGFAGEVRGNELWLDAAVPAETIQSAGTFRKK
ncbi:MAG: hypothetical protein L0228_07670 [Planctomycetes bacterium]|nr:hypothetical protein [Planctomycetota bacterium]